MFRHKVTSIGCGTLLSLAQWLASTYQYRKDTFSKPALLKNILYRSPWKITIIIIKVHMQVSSEETHHAKELHKVKSWKRGPWGDSSVPSPKTQPETLISWHSSVSALFQVMYRLAVRRLIMSKNYTSEVWKRGPWGDSSVPSPKSSPTTRNSFCFCLKE